MLAKNRNTTYREGIELDFPVAANTKIYAGSLVCVNEKGYAVPAADRDGYTFIGVSLEQIDNSTYRDGDKSIRVRRKGVFNFKAVEITQSMVGKTMYVYDDETFFASYYRHHIKIGLLVKYVSSTQGWIDIGVSV